MLVFAFTRKLASDMSPDSRPWLHGMKEIVLVNRRRHRTYNTQRVPYLLVLDTGQKREPLAQRLWYLLEVQMQNIHDDFETRDFLIRELDNPLSMGWDFGLGKAAEEEGFEYPGCHGQNMGTDSERNLLITFVNL